MLLQGPLFVRFLGGIRGLAAVCCRLDEELAMPQILWTAASGSATGPKQIQTDLKSHALSSRMEMNGSYERKQDLFKWTERDFFQAVLLLTYSRNMKLIVPTTSPAFRKANLSIKALLQMCWSSKGRVGVPRLLLFGCLNSSRS